MQIIIPHDATQLEEKIVRRAQLDVPILENPPGSNRSPEIDAMCVRWGVPLASYWCALQAATVWDNAGAEVPPINGSSHPASCQSWYEWARATGRFGKVPRFGAATLYGKLGEPPAHHIGTCVVVTEPYLMDFEGNTSLSSFSRNGEIYTLKIVEPSLLIGFVYAEPRESVV